MYVSIYLVWIELHIADFGRCTVAERTGMNTCHLLDFVMVTQGAFLQNNGTVACF